MGWYVGLDVHSKRSVFVVEREDGTVVARGEIPTTPTGFRQLREQVLRHLGTLLGHVASARAVPGVNWEM